MLKYVQFLCSGNILELINEDVDVIVESVDTTLIEKLGDLADCLALRHNTRHHNHHYNHHCVQDSSDM